MVTGGRAALALIVLVLVSMPAVAEPISASYVERHVERLVARPSPVGPVRIASDEASWRVSVPSHAVVLVEAQGAADEPFVLRAGPAGSGSMDALVLPTTHAGFLLSTPGDWRVRVDPVAGVAVDILVTFEGRVADVDGARTAFTLDEEATSPLCVVAEVCLP